MSKKVYLTNEGLKKIKKELQDRKTIIAEKIADTIDESRKLGDLSENASYKSALEDREYNITKIRELEEKIKMAEVFTGNSTNSRVDLGDKVTLRHESKIVIYTVVGATEADPSKGRISNESPIGASILGKKEGEVIKISTPNGEVEYVIEKVG